MQDGYTALILDHYYDLDKEAEEFYDSNAEKGPLGQTADSDGFYYYGTRGALGVSTAATAGAVAVGTAEAAFLGNQSILVEGVVGGTGTGSGGLFQIRPPGRPPWFRIDIHPIRPGGKPTPHIDSPPFGWHHWPWQ